MTGSGNWFRIAWAWAAYSAGEPVFPAGSFQRQQAFPPKEPYAAQPVTLPQEEGQTALRRPSHFPEHGGASRDGLKVIGQALFQGWHLDKLMDAR